MPDAFLPPADLTHRLSAIVGTDHLASDASTCAAMSEDIYAQGGLASFVIAPANLDELSRVLAAANQAGKMVVPRGGGKKASGIWVPVLRWLGNTKKGCTN